ncbi:vacuolar protein sorting/targeting protein 10 [Purpureocillium lilacinum]|uniref:Vacuolar protein sorting/targeting protein 10 n=1 Tax=Purpureocillium lilacinum TaxID=33203 RepID=A0A179HNS0_PURLI|nr:vacuolar protein sorting/targeting protein 10 [Purpureocillium lilacinum]OAQ91967.1 vacuolar protein sorting/targeting protein 10 [Purpureocillium lilacinum]
MRPRAMAPPAAAWRLLLAVSVLWASLALAKDGPDMTVNTFDHPPLYLSYFEDSDAVVFQDVEEGNVYRSKDAGAKWERVSAVPEGKSLFLIMHQFDPKTAFILTASETHFKTEDRGETWTKFQTGVLPSKFQPETLVFHADDPNRIIFNAMNCQDIFCEEQAMYTIDGFKTTKPLRSLTGGCWWAKSSKEFTTGDAELDKSRILCVVRDRFSLFKSDQRLFVSDSFFAVKDGTIQEFEPNVDTNKGVPGVLNLAVVKKYLLVATSAARTDEMALFITDDTLKWHRAMFPKDESHDHSHRINQEAYTVLEGTNYSIQIDVMTSHPSNPMGVLFTSNSNGTYFTENIPYTNRNRKGHVDFEKISGIQGIFLVNTVENGAEVQKKGRAKDKVIVSQITFDDGRTFHKIKAGDTRLHLHSVTELDNVGRVFSSPAPGLVMGNGNTGDSLGKFLDANLFVSDNAGLTWKKALDGPHKYEFGDSGSILVAVKDSSKEDVKEFSYSLDHGENWKQVALPKDLAFKPDLLTTTQDSTSLKFILLGEKKGTYHMVAINFDGLHERTCGDDDMEDWHARVDDDGKPTCIMGHKQTFRRRKKTADCFIKKEFKDPVPKNEDCECSDADFECDYNFQRDDDGKTCKQAGPIPIPDGACKDNPDGTFKGSSGWRLIPGNTCKRPSGKQKDDKVERKCSEGGSKPVPPATDKVSSTKVEFDAELKDFQKVYLERGGSSSSTDETLIVRPVEYVGDGTMKIEPKLWISHDHGKKFSRILEGENIKGIYPHLYFKDVVYFTTSSHNVLYTVDRGESFHKFKAPTAPDPTEFPLSFHPDKKDWLIWLGKKCEKVGKKKSCFKEASISTDRGDNWRTLRRYAEKCEFTGHSAYKFRGLKQVVCLVRKEERNDGPMTVVSSDDFFEEDRTTHEGEVINFATMSEFIVLAGKDGKSEDLHPLASLDGKSYDRAHYPHNFREGHQNEYTLLDSSTHAINLFVRTEGGPDRQYGSIIKSNSNGTSYVLSAANVNCNEDTYVDFEKISGLEGVTLINVVTNTDKKEKTKTLQTKISHNDGSEWGYLAPPAKDSDGKSYSCSSSKGDSSCALHFHHYTEREDKRRTFSADTAIGLLFGVGNVGSSLGDIKDADTFMSRDGGVTWTSVKKGHWTWRYGDQGSIIVLAQRATHASPAKTKIVSYSLDEGKTWKEYTFADEDVTILDISTLDSGTSRNFLLWCKSGSGKTFSVNLDFTGLANKACEFKKDSQADSDYYLWSPKHPLQDDDCLFGHVARYLRKKADRKCYNEQSIQRLYDHKDCQCSRRDYECAYNYELDNHGQCKLVRGLEPLSGKEWCSKHPNETSWFEPTGYRKVPLSTCQGGNELDKTSTEHPCEGHEDEFEKKHRTSGVVIFFAVVIPFAIAGAVGWWVYRNWDGKFGQIRLGDQSSTFDSDRPWVKYPVIAVSAVAAVVAALPLIAASLWRSAVGSYDRVRGGSSDRSWFSSGPRRFTTRDSFARGRGDYAVVDDVEGELLGEESDEEI